MGNGTEIIGTLAETYLRRRRFDPLPLGLRFHPRCPYLPKPQTQFHPALLVPVHEGRRLTAIVRILLRPDGSYWRKVMLGTPGRGAWRGGAPDEMLAIAEGFETARAFTQLHGIPCWATLGARRFDQPELPQGLTRLLLAGDNDVEGRRAMAKARDAYARPNLEIIDALPQPGFKDWAKRLEAPQAAGRPDRPFTKTAPGRGHDDPVPEPQLSDVLDHLSIGSGASADTVPLARRSDQKASGIL